MTVFWHRCFSPKSLSKRRSHNASCVASASATYSASVEDNETQDCFLHAQLIDAPKSWNVYPLFDFRSILSWTQSASAKLINFLLPSGRSIFSCYPFVPFKYRTTLFSSVQSCAVGLLLYWFIKIVTLAAMFGLEFTAMYNKVWIICCLSFSAIIVSSSPYLK